MNKTEERLPPKDFGRKIYSSKKYLVLTEDSKGTMEAHFNKPEDVGLIINFIGRNDKLRKTTIEILNKIEESTTTNEEGN